MDIQRAIRWIEGSLSLARQHWKLVGASIGGFLIAVGAYSEDSLAVRLFYRPSLYSVSVGSTFWAPAGSAVCLCSYLTGAGELLAPVQLLIYLQVRNDSYVPQLIDAVHLDVQGAQKQWINAKILRVVEGTGVYWPNSTNGLKEARTQNLDGVDLLQNLGKGPIAPGGLVSGWIPVEFPRAFTFTNPMDCGLRVTLFSPFKESESHELRLSNTYPDGAAETRGATMDFGETRDISGLRIIAWGDFISDVAPKLRPGAHPGVGAR